MCRAYTADCRRVAMFRKVTPAKRSGAVSSPEASEFLDIYDVVLNSKIHSCNLKSAEQHGKVHIGACNAIRLSILHSSFQCNEFAVKEHWGEQMNDICHPVIAIFNLDGGTITVLDNLIDDWTPTEVSYPVWQPDGSGFMFVAMNEKPIKLGRLFCFNRECRLVSYSFKSGKAQFISPPGNAISSPRFSLDGTKLVYLATEIGGPHAKRISDDDVILVNTVAKTNSDEEFPGLYAADLPHRCWSNDGKRVFMSSVWGSTMVILSVDIENDHSWMLLDVAEDYLLASVSSPNSPNRLALSHLPGKESNCQVKWLLFPETAGKRPFSRVENSFSENIPYEAIYLRPIGKDQYPLILWPHGGPHSAYLTSFALLPALFTSLGFAVLRVNYRGSFGFGEDFLRALPGRVGKLDVLDCRHACDTVCEYDRRIDPNRIALFGASHGGFLALHLIGQFARNFRACVALNPVTNISAMYNCSDIPDWCVVEALGEDLKPGNVLDKQKQRVMWEASPIQYAEKVTTPTLFLLGKIDLRVPSSQCKEFISVLKSRNVPVRVLSYPENSHPLNKVDAECDFALNALAWIDRWLKTTPEQQQQ
ncbi:Peptidase S9 domain containing protein [Trichuris trichiura]|uniref:Acylamino-acid-releasing enzyme n=1 Tax=Trichuris trichiura TaxID=36087 RepID=A0A077Z8E5_TRITR|nr:Peptidase S9 domain containing protein [Trichuris trichiura]